MLKCRFDTGGLPVYEASDGCGVIPGDKNVPLVWVRVEQSGCKVGQNCWAFYKIGEDSMPILQQIKVFVFVHEDLV